MKVHTLAALALVTVVSGQTIAGPVFGDVPLSNVLLNFSYLLRLAQHFSTQTKVRPGWPPMREKGLA